MYHLVTPRPPANFEKYAVRPSEFARQVRWLRLAGYRPVGIEELLAHRAAAAPLPKRAVVITFDDGYLDCLRYAVPILSAYRFVAVFYLVSGLLGKTSRWLLEERGINLPLLDLPAARELAATGFQIGSHSVSHPHLTTLPADGCREELCASREALEDGLGLAVEHLAYPYGDFDARVRTMAAEAGYRTACGVRAGLARPGDDLLSLPRVPVSGGDRLFDFACRLVRASRPIDLLRGKLALADRLSLRR
jgi:peptidoglycan/xylan/chitin deacetylase (PgdA/CDA1 family)